MRVEDYYQNGIKRWFRLHEKAGKRHEVPAHHNEDEFVHALSGGRWHCRPEEGSPFPLGGQAPQADG
jgi:hypothetical protein